MRPSELLGFALTSLTSPSPAAPEASYRRAISACYYGLFHRLAEAGAHAFSGAGAATAIQARRAFKHTEMKTVCERYRAWTSGKPLATPLNTLVEQPPDPRLLSVATTFIRLQELRESADYDLATERSLQEATDAFQLAFQAFADFDAIEHEPATKTFLTALLMADRWKRGG